MQLRENTWTMTNIDRHFAADQPEEAKLPTFPVLVSSTVSFPGQLQKWWAEVYSWMVRFEMMVSSNHKSRMLFFTLRDTEVDVYGKSVVFARRHSKINCWRSHICRRCQIARWYNCLVHMLHEEPWVKQWLIDARALQHWLQAINSWRDRRSTCGHGKKLLSPVSGWEVSTLSFFSLFSLWRLWMSVFFWIGPKSMACVDFTKVLFKVQGNYFPVLFLVAFLTTITAL